MNSKLIAILFLIYMTDSALGGEQKKSSRKSFLVNEVIDQCEGKDSYNFTGVGTYTTDQSCDIDSYDPEPDDDTLTACLPTGAKSVVELATLARSIYPAGAYFETQHLALALSGVLEGKYILRKAIIQSTEYLKECSSVLGHQIVQSKVRQTLISDKLDLNCLIAPTGAWECFKKGCTTQCRGRLYIVQSQANV